MQQRRGYALSRIVAMTSGFRRNGIQRIKHFRNGRRNRGFQCIYYFCQPHGDCHGEPGRYEPDGGCAGYLMYEFWPDVQQSKN